MSRAILAVTAATALARDRRAALSRPSGTPMLRGTDCPGFTITLKHNGALVKTLKAGKYKFVVNDKSNFHGFSLDGPHGFAKDFASSITVPRHEVGRREPQGWQVQILLPEPRVDDVRPLHGEVATRADCSAWAGMSALRTRVPLRISGGRGAGEVEVGTRSPRIGQRLAHVGRGSGRPSVRGSRRWPPRKSSSMNFAYASKLSVWWSM